MEARFIKELNKIVLTLPTANSTIQISLTPDDTVKLMSVLKVATARALPKKKAEKPTPADL